jgi:hypothetical protein
MCKETIKIISEPKKERQNNNKQYPSLKKDKLKMLKALGWK